MRGGNEAQLCIKQTNDEHTHTLLYLFRKKVNYENKYVDIKIFVIGSDTKLKRKTTKFSHFHNF